jgi:chromosome segregation protein
MARVAAETLQAEHLRAEARRAALRPELQRRTQERQKASEAAEAARRALAALEDGHGSAGLLRDAARASELAGLALEQARTERLAARLAAASSQTAQQNLAAACLQAEARLEAARLAAGRAEADLAEAIAFQARIGGELDALADPAEAEARLAAAADALQEAGGREETARARRAQAEQSLDAAREADARLRGDEARTTSLLAGLSATLDRLLADLQLAGQDEAAAERAVADCPDQAALAAQADAAREDLRRARLAAADAETELSDIMAEARRAEAAAGPVAADLAAWRTRLQDAGDRVGALTTRRDAADLHMRALSARPAELEARAAASTAALAAAQVDHQAALSRLHAADQLVRGLAIAQRDAEQVHAAARERLVRTDAEHEAAFGGLQAVLARVKHRLAADAVLPACADCSDAAEERARKKYERLSREREEMGPVNLRAELELEEIEQRIAALAREHEELTTAIARLRGAIGHLNREGRERLSKVFAEVDQHFRALFTRMMGGGRAHLALTGSEDPLQAGLEIYAEPPGKKLSSLSLLSGGEQALTALSLVFAVFRCTPAPISVLDEVDAPLDDANVERFCSLLDDMVRHTGTRFLVVTHHQLTMSRMDRLFGVTMQERGVSRLLSVDLHRAIAMVEPALQAAE